MISVAVLGRAQGQADAFFPGIYGNWNITHYDWHNPPDVYVEYGGVHWDSTTVLVDSIFKWSLAQSYNGWWGFDGLIAVDSDRVLIRPIGSGDTLPIQVLYDFGLNLGDTAYLGDEPPWTIATVTTIDTVFAAGRTRRRLTFSNADEWIAGIGSRSGFFFPVSAILFEDSYELTNFCGGFINDDGVAYDACWPQELGMTENSGRELTIYPNPCSQSFSILTTGRNETCRVVNDLGQTVLEHRITGRQEVVDVTRLYPGIYTVMSNGSRSRLVIE